MKAYIDWRTGIGNIGLASVLTVFSCYAMAISPRDVGGKGDVVTLRDGAIDQGSNAFHAASANFSKGDAGKVIIVSGAVAGGSALVTQIQAVESPQRATLAAAATRSIVHAVTYYGTDDTAAIRSCVFKGTATGDACTITDGVTFLVSNTKSTITPFGAGHNPIMKGTIDGHGRIIFAPQEPMTGGTNDRLFYLSSQETRPMPIAGAIAKGATSFNANDAADAATLVPGDWIIITERDSGVRDNVYADWMQVSEVRDATVITTNPFRMAFPNVRSWGGPPNYWGLGFRKIGPITSNLTMRDITIIIPKLKAERAVIAIDTRDTRGTVITNVTCQDASGNCFVAYMDQGLVFQNNTMNGSVYSEFASMVDATISSNHIDQSDTEMSLAGPPAGGGLEVDFGTAFSSVQDNEIGSTRQSCLMLFAGIHDTVVSRNSCGIVTFGSASNCVLCRSCYRVTVSENSCEGGTGNSRGIDVGEAGTSAPLYSEGNRIFNNRVRGFAVPLSCVGRMKRDSCQQ